jgi:hypothetical protein
MVTSKTFVPRNVPAVVLAVDTARRSGHATGIEGKRIGSGACDIYSPIVDEVVLAALNVADNHALPAVLVLERTVHYTGKGQRRGAGAGVGLGAAIGVWKSAWVRNGGVKSRVVTVAPNVWRPRVLGHGMGQASREDARVAELQYARAVTGRYDVDADEAAAICILAWAWRAPEVLKVLPKRVLKAAGLVS